ncbi:MAG: Trp family transcriptional regulator [Candidatus Sungiibacteriota bacterium]
MPHISKQKLDKEVLRSINDRLVDILADITLKEDIHDFINDLLTRTERIMLAKRLAIVVMLHKGYPFGVIRRTLKVSESTISAMRDRTDRGGKGFEKALRRLEKDKRLEKFIANLDRIIRLFAMPPIAGKGRWKFLVPR